MGFPDIESRNRALESSAPRVKWSVRFLLRRFPKFHNEREDIEQFAWLILLQAAEVFCPDRGRWAPTADRYLKHLAAKWFRHKNTQVGWEWEDIDEITHTHYYDGPRFQVVDLAQAKVFRKIEFPTSPERRKRQQREAMRRARGLSVEKARALESHFLVAA